MKYIKKQTRCDICQHLFQSNFKLKRQLDGPRRCKPPEQSKPMLQLPSKEDPEKLTRFDKAKHDYSLKRHKCPRCGMRFSQKSFLAKHAKDAHKPQAVILPVNMEVSCE